MRTEARSLRRAASDLSQCVSLCKHSNFTEKYVSKIYKSGQPHQNVNNLIINTCRFCINRDKWGGYKDEKFQQFTISPLKNA